ncbi:MAG: dipeptidyl carboxypeptidase, partial [Xanthomonadaceae bacterium]|nr:dipeptidyl carboxypeptidase [Xanthomonadaceae bacterium]
MKHPLALALAVALTAAAPAYAQSSSPADANVPASSNPLLSESSLPFHAPRFDLVKETDYQPAIEAGMQQHMVEVEKIANNPKAPTFENTFVALEKSGATLTRVMNTFGGVTGANTSDLLQKVQETEAPKLAEHSDAITLNGKLFKRIETVYNQRAKLNLDPESLRLVEVTYRNFVRAGARLSEADKTRLKALNKEESTLSTQFTNMLLAATKAGAVVVDSKAKLAGLSDSDIQAAAQAAKDRKLDGKYVITLQNTTQQPALQDLDDRSVREALFKASWDRAEKADANDTRKTIERIAQIRAQQAKLVGFSSYGAWKLQDQMAKTPQAAIKFMQDLVPASTARARAEAADIQAVIDSQKGGFQVQAWDWQHYAEQVRKARYDMDESQIKPYFELDSVLQKGVFYAANQLYGLTFKERKDIPVYQPDVRVFEVFDKDGSSLTLFYADYFKRDNKNGGAWMSNFVDQSKLLGKKPVIYNVANFTKPAAGSPALISFDDVTTMFHEFGHALHGLFGDQVYPTLSGTNTARDWVEFPSQFNEHWALDPKVLANYAKDYRTGAPMPQALVDKIKKAAKFNQGYALGETVEAAILDMDWHSLPASAPRQDVDAFEKQQLDGMGFDTTNVPPRYRSSYFLHIWANGYSAGYYAYLWTQMLEHDSYHWFMDHGGLTRENGERFRDLILSRGH